ncbi:MAG TPA: hypothetical protein VGD92_03915 [Sphingobacteriaceae bacterium]
MKKNLLLLGLLILVTAEIRAQEDVTSNVAAKIAAVTEISASGTKDDAVFNFTTAAELTDGITLPPVFTLTAKSNKPYYVTVAAAAANFSGGSVSDPLPVEKLLVKIDAGSFVPLSASATTIIGAGTNAARGIKEYVIHYRMEPGFDAAPALDYTTTLTYTITAP